MSELDKLNAGVKLSMAARRKAAVARIAITVLWVLAALGVFIGLQAIHFISLVFMVILMAIAVCVGTFKIGYIWHDIKF